MGSLTGLDEGPGRRGNSDPKATALFRILWLASISLMVQFFLDAVAFRTPFYPHYVEPESFTGSYEVTLRNERSRILTGSEHVLIFGDSSIAEGFSASLANT